MPTAGGVENLVIIYLKRKVASILSSSHAMKHY